MAASTAQAEIRRFLDDRRADQVAFLAELVRTPSDNPPGNCAAHAEHAATLLEGLGFTVERHAVDEADCAAQGMVSATNLIVRQRFGPGPVIALNAHGDVVAPGAGWTRDPYGATVDQGVMYGRGVAVSKSDFATYSFALLALQALAQPLAGTVELHFTYDEEVGGEIGPKWLLERGLSRPDYVISAGFAYAVVTAHNGCLHLEVTLRGRSAHAAQPDSGHDALEAATAVLAALYGERAGYGALRSAVEGIGSPSLTIGLIEGGINTNVVPDRVSFRLDRRLIPEEDPVAVEQRLREVVAQVADRFTGITATVGRILLSAPLQPLPGVERLAASLSAHASRVFGEPVGTKGVPLYTDARHYATAGIPTLLYGAGPRSLLEANAHRADECLRLDDLQKATEVVAGTLQELLTPTAS